MTRNTIGRWLLASILAATLWFPAGSAYGQSQELVEAYKQANILRNQGRHQEALPFAKKALNLTAQEFGANHHRSVVRMSYLARLYNRLGRYTEAEPLYKLALATLENLVGPKHPFLVTPLNDLAELYRTRGRYSEAEPLYKRALGIQEKAFGPDHFDVATSRMRLAQLYVAQGRYAEAEQLCERARATHACPGEGTQHRPVVKPPQAAPPILTYCYDPRSDSWYAMGSGDCLAGDEEITKAQYEAVAGTLPSWSAKSGGRDYFGEAMRGADARARGTDAAFCYDPTYGF